MRVFEWGWPPSRNPLVSPWPPRRALMIVPDANLLIYASDSRLMFLERSRRWWPDALNGD